MKCIMRLILALAAHFKPNSVRQSSSSPSAAAAAAAAAGGAVGGVGAAAVSTSGRQQTTVAGIAQVIDVMGWIRRNIYPIAFNEYLINKFKA